MSNRMKKFCVILAAVIACICFTSCTSVFNTNVDVSPTEAANRKAALAQNDTIAEETTAQSTQAPLVTEAPPTVENKNYPVGLDEVHVIDSAFYYFSDGDVTDTFGNSHHKYHNFGGYDEAYAIFNLNGEYTKFSGSWVLHHEDGSDSHYYITIYTDGVPVYESEELTKTTGEVPFAVDVTDCSQLKIEMSGSYHGHGAYLVDAVLE